MKLLRLFFAEIHENGPIFAFLIVASTFPLTPFPLQFSFRPHKLRFRNGLWRIMSPELQNSRTWLFISSLVIFPSILQKSFSILRLYGPPYFLRASTTVL